MVALLLNQLGLFFPLQAFTGARLVATGGGMGICIGVE